MTEQRNYDRAGELLQNKSNVTEQKPMTEEGPVTEQIDTTQQRKDDTADRK